jgi:hypothetical protein
MNGDVGDDFMLRKFGDSFDSLTLEQKRRLRTKIRAMNFDGGRTPPPTAPRGVADDRGTQKNNSNHNNGECKTTRCAGEEGTSQSAATTTTATIEAEPSTVFLRNRFGHERRKLVVRSLSDGTKSKSDFLCLSNNLRQDGGGPENHLQVAFQSLTLASAFKSLSDSKLFCCPKDGEQDRSEKTLSCSFPENERCRGQKMAPVQKVVGGVDGSFGNENSERLFSGEGRLDSCSDRIVFGKMRRQVVKLLQQQHEQQLVRQLKCPSTNDRGSLGSSASLELVSLLGRGIESPQPFRNRNQIVIGRNLLFCFNM